MADNGEGMSKSAKKRAAKKARDEAFAESNPAPPPAPAPAPKAKGKAAPAPESEPKAKAKGKAKAAPEPAPQPKAEPKAKGKAKAKAEPEPVAPPPPPPAPKAKGKAKAKAKAAPVEEEPVVEQKKNDELINYVMDDGTGGAWEVCTGMSKKAERSKKKAEEAKKAESMPVNIKRVPGAEFADEPKGKNAGPSQAAAAEVKRILAMKGEAQAQDDKQAGPALSSVIVQVPENRIGVVIGPKGANITVIQEKTKTKVDTSGGIFTITGGADDVLAAEKAINDLVSKGYCELMYEGFTENIISVNPSAFPDLIGKEGCIVRAIKDKLKVEINFQDVSKGSTKKGKVTLAGKTEDVEQAKQVINDIIMYQHHEITHPGWVHETVDVEEWAYRYIIGKAGSELKHIQHNWKVKVSIPREDSAFKSVLVVGTPDSVMRAKAYIDKLVWNAENNAKGRDRQDNSAADPWGEEEEEEPWMKQYMYKR
mmetsp:Transcript_41093/g.88679  ORF Transcript_41093/g.88679 Transcript_41093/m.88679 type:complete len:480 (+) Transcript_41093:99-1538(+)|eukprot:CAMPEP_0206441060 /NCGR_PEP_ID=MMETSP0324_2-20121206/13078_1 /ASSEMBLY_ACC=CAM_ASM_000836 /TAXON_ID=2866 /ORGANISM="Crypthecodinium cohnii, Strain Seligo" /LENGTH=479 /DNA_ID=CAMNT_0053908793 /DNA_START=97 /DNA_END=1536 /DNA_ORIENTATION=+